MFPTVTKLRNKPSTLEKVPPLATTNLLPDTEHLLANNEYFQWHFYMLLDLHIKLEPVQLMCITALSV